MGAGSNNGGMEAYAASLKKVTADSESSQNAEGSHLLQGWLCKEGWPNGGIPTFEKRVQRQYRHLGQRFGHAAGWYAPSRS